MHASADTAGGGAIPEPDESRILPARDPPPGRAGDPAELTLLLVEERDRIAGALNDVVIHRIFSAGLALETALGLIDGHRGAAGKVREALAELDLAIRDVRNVVFDHHKPDPPSGGPPG
jgi:signal transduction histidine kinase